MPEQEERIDRHRATQNSLKCETLCNVQQVSRVACTPQQYSLINCKGKMSAYVLLPVLPPCDSL